MAARRDKLRIAVLLSGRGSNFVALADSCQRGDIFGEIVQVISDQASAAGLTRARERGLSATLVSYASFRQPDGRVDRSAFERAVLNALQDKSAEVVVLAGFMKVLSAEFVAAYAGRMLNIHPSLLPRHKGLDTHARALAAGDAEHGASVHFVTAELDGGPVILQGRLKVRPGDTAEALSARVHGLEHMIYPMVIKWMAAGRLELRGSKVQFDGAPLPSPLQLSAEDE